MTDIKRLATQYFNAFSRKDIDGIRAALADDVSLRDWEISQQGIEGVVAATAGIFASCGTIDVIPTAVYVDSNVVVAELAIAFDGGAPLLVLDVLEFNGAGEISSIRAFKG